jgi:hypothetical protein
MPHEVTLELPRLPTAGAITLKLRVERDGIFGEVVDQGGGFEREVRERGLDEFTGRGLMIVDALSRRWGIHEGTTHVWFELAQPDDPPRLTEPELGEAERPDGLDAAASNLSASRSNVPAVRS